MYTKYKLLIRRKFIQKVLFLRLNNALFEIIRLLIKKIWIKIIAFVPLKKNNEYKSEYILYT